MPKYYLPKSDDIVTHNLKSTCRYILCLDQEDVTYCTGELYAYLTTLKCVYAKGLAAYSEVIYLAFAESQPVFRHDFFITLAEYIEDPPDETNTVLFSGEVSDLFVASAKPKGA